MMEADDGIRLMNCLAVRKSERRGIARGVAAITGRRERTKRKSLRHRALTGIVKEITIYHEHFPHCGIGKRRKR